MKTQSLPNLFNRVVLKITIFAIIIFLCKIVGAVPACPEPAEVEQPDGKKIKIKLHGDEFFSWHEDEEGYAIKQKANGAWFYARPSKDKADFEIIEDAPVGSVDPKALGLKKHDLPSQHLIKERISKQLEQISPSNLKKDGKTKEKETESDDTLPAPNESNSAPSNGSSAEEIPPPTDGGTAPPLSASPFQPNLKCVVILAAFNDHWDTGNNTVLSTRGKIRDNYDTLFNTSGTTIDGAVGSVNDYYNQISYGKTNIQFIVSDWVKLDYDESYYGDNANEWTGENRVKLLASHAVAKADAAGFDFSQGDGDGDGWVDLLVIVHSGYSESVSSNPSTCIWPRAWAMTNDVTCDGKKMYRFCIVSAMSGLQSSSTYMMRIGTVVHEMGHLFGLKDVYDVGNATKGVGTWCLMAFGSWGASGSVSSEMRPVHLCAFSKMILGYIDPTPVQTKTGISLARLSSSPVAHILRSSVSADEYFLVENRGSDSTSNFDYNLPKGILITHVDTKVYNVMNHSGQWLHPALRVEEANGGNTLATNAVANATHVWTSSNGLSGGFRDTTGNVYTNAMTYQSSHQYQRTDNSANYTGIRASNFSSASATMTYDLQTRVPTVNSATVYSSSYNVSWTASAGASMYELQEGTSTTATSFTDNAESLADMRANWQNLGAVNLTTLSNATPGGASCYELSGRFPNATDSNTFMPENRGLILKVPFTLTSSTAISFKYLCMLSTGYGYMKAQLSKDNGTNWSTLGTYSGYAGSWTTVTYNYSTLSAAGFTAGDTCILRFLVCLDELYGWNYFPYFGYAIDDVSITNISYNSVNWTTLANNITGTSYPISGKSSGTYYYRIRAYANSAWQDYSDAASVTVILPPEMDLSRNSNPIADGGSDIVTGTAAGIGKQLTYVIANTGGENLTLTTPVSISSQSNCSVNVDTQPSSPVLPSATTNLVVTITPTNAGAWSFNISIANNDSDENPYNWTVSGNAGTLTTDYFQQGNLPGGSYSGVADTYLDQASSSTNYGSSTTLALNNKSGKIRYGLIKFDISSIPSGSTVTAASIEFTENGGGTTGSVEIYQATADWNANTANYTNDSSKVGSTLLGSGTANNTAGNIVSISLNSSAISYIQNWIDNSSTNFGFGIKTNASSNTTSVFLRSSDYATATNRPKLAITYIAPQIPAPEMDVTRSGSPIADGSTDSVSGTVAGTGTQLTYVIANNGNANLTLSNAVKSAESNCAATINTQPSSPVSPSGSTNLVVTVTPTAAGAWSFNLSIDNNDSDENPYNWTVSGTAEAPAPKDYTWAPGGVQDAGGTWNTTTANWTPGPIAWQNGTSPADNAIFGDATAARTVTLSGTINANSIVFNDPSTSYDSFWTLDSGTLNLLGSALIDPRGNNNYRINSIMTGTSGLLLDTTSGSRAGNSETRLAGNNTYTGITKIYDSTLAAYHSNAFGATGTGNHTEIYANGRAFIAGTNGTSTPITVSEDIYLKATNTTAIRSSNANNILAGNIINFVNAAGGNDVGINVGTNNTFTITGNISSAALGGASYYTRTILSAGADATSKIIVSGSISNNADGTITKLLIDGSSTGTNSGTVELAGDNSFTGEIVIRRGTLLLSSENAVGYSAGIIFADGGLSDSTNTLRLLTNGAYTISQNISLNIANGSNTYTAVIGGNSAHSSTYSGNITINDTNAGTYQLTAAEGGTVTFSGLINDGANSKAISKIGTGTVILSKTTGNTYDGGTTVTAGTLSIANTSGSATGTGNVTVNSGATLAGYGTIGGANVTINGTLTPNGTITLSNTNPTLAFGNGAQVNFDLGSTSDKIAFTNPGILSGSGNADLNLTLGTGFSYSNTYTIFENVSTNDFSFKSINGYDTNVYQAILAKDGNNYVLSFTQIKFFVTYDGNTNTGGTPPTDSNSYAPGANVTVLGKNTLVKDGYKFVCWNTAPNASGTNLYPGGTFGMPANNLTLYAIWEYIPQWTVTFQTDPSGITLIGETPQIVSDEQDCSPVTAIAPKGYRFQKWLKDGYDYSNANSITITYVKSNMNFTAVFIKKCGIYDFNADDKADVLSESLSGTSAGNGNIYLMNPSGFTYLPPTSATLYSKGDLNWQVAKFADLTGDKRCDLLWRHTGTGKVMLYTTKESGLEINPGIVIYSGGAWTPIESTDFNNDGKEDILWKYADTSTAKYMVNFMNGASVIGSKSISKGSTDWEIVKVADFNGDSSEDALYMSKTTKTGIVYFLDRGNLLSTAKIFEKGAGWDIKAVGDFDANGAADILLESTDGKAGFIILLKNRLTDGNSGVKNSGIAYFKSDVNWKLLQTGDFNNDGKDDLLWENATTGQGMIWVMNGMTASSTKIIYTLSVVNPATKWTVIKLLDLNADGKADILWEKADTRKALVYLMDGATLKATGKVYTPADNTWKVLNP